MKKMIFALLLSLLSSCGPHYVDYFPYHDDGRMKPHVAFLPVINSLPKTLPSDVSNDMANAIHYHLMDSGQLYALPEEQVKAGIEQCGGLAFFEKDCAFAQQYKDADFIVIIDLIDHTYENCNSRGIAQLVLKARVKVIDARFRESSIALQEIMARDYTVYAVPGAFETEQEHYAMSISKAHNKFAVEIAQRIEQVILCER